MSWLSRVANVFRGDRVTDDLDDELRFHLEATAEQLVAEGLTAEEATRQARRRLGNSGVLRERSRDIKLLPWLDAIVRDIGFGARMLRKDAVAMGAAAISLGLAMGACAAAFMLVDALILRPLPVREPDRLVYLARPPVQSPASPAATPPRETASFNYPIFERFRAAGAHRVELTVVGSQFVCKPKFHDAPASQEKVRAQYVSGNFFDLLGIVPARGRVLTPSDDQRSTPRRVAVLSYAFWQRRFGGDPSVLGRVFTFDDGPGFEIVGVAREGFTGVEPGILTDFWVPATTYKAEALTSPGWQWFRIFGRLADGVTVEEIGQRFQPVFRDFRRERARSFPAVAPEEERARFINAPLVARSAANGPSSLREDFERPLWVLAAIVVLVLLLACSNVANLLIGRGASREREMALRLSIGAGRARLVQQLLIESALLAVTACVLGTLFAAFAAPGIVRWLAPSDQPAYLDLRFDARVLGFLVLLASATTVLFGLVPAVRASSVSPIEALKAAAGRLTVRARLLRPLVTAQVGFSLSVVFLAALLLLSFQRLVSVDAGFVADGLVLVEVEALDRVEGDVGKRAVLDVLERVRALPGVTSASVSAWPLMKGWEWTGPIRLPGRRLDPREINFLEVSPGFMQTMRMAFREGRDFTARDLEPTEPRMVIVSEAFARAYFPSGVVGQTFERPEGGGQTVTYEIAGVVRNAKYGTLREETPPTVYVPLRGRRGASVQVRTAMAPELAASLVRAAAAKTTPAMTVTDVMLQSTLVENTVIRERLLALLAGFFAVVSLALAAVGLYGVLSYSVAQRTREIGIRLTLGARRRAVVQQVLRDVAGYAAVGIASGVAGGLYGARFVKTLLFEVEPMDPVSLLLPIAGLLVVATLAAVIPARRAASVDPIVALRDE